MKWGRISSYSFEKAPFSRGNKAIPRNLPFLSFLTSANGKEWAIVTEASSCLTLKIGSDGKHMQTNETTKESFSILRQKSPESS